MKHLRLYIFAVVALVSIYGVVGYFRGNADFDAVEAGKTPTYASKRLFYGDGGTTAYIGLGYTVYHMHRILLDPTQTNPATGFLGGAKIEWSYPMRLLLRDEDLYYYIPDR